MVQGLCLRCVPAGGMAWGLSSAIMDAVLLCMVLCRLKALKGSGHLSGWCVVQVGYCQGMAFVTGIILMYLPEEPAFQVP